MRLYLRMTWVGLEAEMAGAKEGWLLQTIETALR
jgi:hypothetical protein